MVYVIAVLAGLAIFAGIFGSKDVMTGSEIQEKYEDRRFSYLYCGT